MADKSALTTKMDENSDGLPQGTISPYLGWFKLKKEYDVFEFVRELWVRYVTSEDDNLAKESGEKYKRYVEARGNMLPYLLEHFRASEAYERVILQI